VPPGRTWLWFLGILLANYLLMRFFVPGPDAPVTVPYTLFKQEVGKGNVEAIHSDAIGEIHDGLRNQTVIGGGHREIPKDLPSHEVASIQARFLGIDERARVERAVK